MRGAGELGSHLGNGVVVLQEQSKFSINYYLLSLLLTLMGTLLFLVNARGLSGLAGLLPVSVFLMVGPALFYIFSARRSLTQRQSLTLLLIPLFALQYIYYLQAGAPVGFTDPHNHIFTYWKLFTDAGKILFENVQQLSLNFVGLYILFRLLSLAGNLDIVTLAAVIPPFLNILIVVAVYLVVSRLHEQRTGLLAAMLYGWEHIALILGQEFRTQTMGVLILFTVTALLLILNRKTARSGVFAALILLAGLATTSFVCNFYALLVFTGALCAVFVWFLWKRDLDWLAINSVSIGLYVMFIAFYAVYLLYISKGFAPLSAQFAQLLFNAAGKAMAPEYGGVIIKSILLLLLGAAAIVGFGLLYLLVKKLTKWRAPASSCLTAGLFFLLSLAFLHYIGYPVAGAAAGVYHYLGEILSIAEAQAKTFGYVHSGFVTWGTYLIWGLWWITYIYYFGAVVKNGGSNKKLSVFFTAYSVLLAYCLVNRLNSPLNPFRPYAAALILLAAAMAYFLYYVPRLVKFRPGQIVIKVVAICLILNFISANLVKKPDYLIGNKYPFQSALGYEDNVPYWQKDEGQYLASDFLASTAPGSKVFACTLMQRYPFLINTYENGITPLYGLGVQAENLRNQKGCLVLLEDKINGKTFYSREALPDAGELDQTVQMIKVYTNDDYLLYDVRK